MEKIVLMKKILTFVRNLTYFTNIIKINLAEYVLDIGISFEN